MPPAPAPKPQASAAVDGAGDAANGSTAATRMALTVEAISVTWITPARREASPAAKSEQP